MYMIQSIELISQNEHNIVHGFVLDLQEYCLVDMFTAQCDAGEVILITEARFGRMKKGKCVTSDRGEYNNTCF